MSEESQPQVDITDDDKLWALLGWIFAPIAPIIILLLQDKKERPFIKYNVIQALVFGIAGWVVSGVLSVVVIGCFVGIGILIYQIYLGIQAYNGNWVTVPFLTNFVKQQDWI